MKQGEKGDKQEWASYKEQQKLFSLVFILFC
jgi:hypothetical protein